MKSVKKRLLSSLLALAMALAVMPTAAFAADGSGIVYNGTESITYQGITFQRQQGGVYDGLPLFDAVPAHLDAYLDVYMDYIGLDGLAHTAIEKRGDYTLVDTYTFSDDESVTDPGLVGKTITWEQKNAGKTIPGSPMFSSPEAVQGYSTNFPAQVGMGQTWNAALLYEVGLAEGREKLYGNGSDAFTAEGSYLSDANQMISHTADVRANPLTGRVDEDYGEDPFLASVLSDRLAAGITGHDLPESDNGFWQMAFVDMKHFSNYLAQWQRNTGNFYNSARGLLEYNARSTYKGFRNDNYGCFMTSYGTTNYIPNGMSPLVQFVKSMSSYPISNMNDNTGELAPIQRLSNEYMTTYWPRRLEQIISQAMTGAAAGYQQRTANEECDDIYATVYAIQSGKLGVSEETFIEQAKGAIINQIRCGILNERDASGNVIGYPFTDVFSGGTVYDYTNKDHQNLALQAAQESVVLLKNNGILPLNKNDDVVVTGPVADSIFATTYAGNVPPGENMGYSPLGGIMNYTGKTAEDLHYTTGAAQIKLKSGDSYIVSSGAIEGTTATGTADDAAIFDVYAWGQDDSISLLETASNKWLGYFPRSGWGASATPAALDLREVALHLNGGTTSDGSLTSYEATLSTMPVTARREWVDENAGTFRLLGNTMTGGYFNSFETDYYGAGVYLKTNEDGSLAVTEPMGSPENASSVRDESTVFTAETVSEAGASVYTGGDAAIVVIGSSPRFSSGEGTDRVDLDLGAEQYALCHAVAEKYPGKTVVVVKASGPVGVQELEDDRNIGAIVTQTYGGEYEGLALAQILYGEVNPSGHLTNTWYTGVEALPVIDNTVIHTNWANDGVTLEDLDPARTVMMTNGDIYDIGLTYMYNDGQYVTYPFGYGLSYSEFDVRTINAPKTAAVGGTFTVTGEVANQSNVPGYAVVQLYATAKDSPYGDAAPKKQLIGFDKVWVEAVTSAQYSITVDPQDFEVYSTTKQDMAVLTGDYTLTVGQSSDDNARTASIHVTGEELGVLDASGRTDVFASAFAANDVYYREYSRQSTLDSLVANEVTDGYYTVVSKDAGAWVAVANVNLSGLKGMQLEVAAKDTAGAIEVRLGSPTGTLIATANVPKTDPVTYDLRDSAVGNNTALEITEQSFVKVDAELSNTAGLGIETICFVFRNAELRLASFTVDADAAVQMPFTDVRESDWFYSDVQSAYASGLIAGSTATEYAPGENMTVAEAVKLAASMYQLSTEGKVTLTNSASGVWYGSYLAYAKDAGIVTQDYADYTAKITRGEYIDLFSRALPAEELAEINAIADGSIPDVAMEDPYAAAIYQMYRAGIVAGDASHRFNAGSSITRGEVAAVLTRMMNASARGEFSIN